MTQDLKNKLQPSIDAFMPLDIFKLEAYYNLHLTPSRMFRIDQRIIHQSRCAKLGRLMALQTDGYVKYLIYNEFKRT